MILGLWSPFWRTEKFRLLLAAFTMLSCSLRLAFWVIVSVLGYYATLTSLYGVSYQTLALVERFGVLFSALSLALFCFILFQAVSEAFDRPGKRDVVFVGGGLAAFSLIGTGYSLGIVITRALHPDEFVYDASVIVLSSLMALFSLFLTGVFDFLLFRVCRRSVGRSHSNMYRTRRNSIIFAFFASLLCILFLVRLVFACLFTFRSMQLNSHSCFPSSEVMSDVVFSASVVTYLGATLWAHRSQQPKLNSPDTDMPEHPTVPLLYRDL